MVVSDPEFRCPARPSFCLDDDDVGRGFASRVLLLLSCTRLLLLLLSAGRPDAFLSSALFELLACALLLARM